MSSLRAYLSDYLLVVAGIFGGNVLWVSMTAFFSTSPAVLLGAAEVVPDSLPAMLPAVIANLLVVIELTLFPAIGVLAVLYADYRRGP
jgi:hypothetical protein